MRDEGLNVDSALELFNDMLRQGDGILSEQQEDCIKDWMDILYGWCSPDFRVWDKNPTGY
jgi:hypothetical protein